MLLMKQNTSLTEDKQKVETPIVETQNQNQEQVSPMASTETQK